MKTTRAYAEAFTELLDRLRRMPMGPAFHQIADLGLSHSHLRAMYILRTNPHLPMGDLAEQLAMTPPSVTALTRRLASLKLLDRQLDPTDSRRVLLALSTKGATMLDAMHTAHIDKFEQLLLGLSASDQEQFLALMEQAVDTLERSVYNTNQEHTSDFSRS